MKGIINKAFGEKKVSQAKIEISTPTTNNTDNREMNAVRQPVSRVKQQPGSNNVVQPLARRA